MAEVFNNFSDKNRSRMKKIACQVYFLSVGMVINEILFYIFVYRNTF